MHSIREAIGGTMSSMNGPEKLMKTVANDVQGLLIPGAGHFLAQEAMLAVLTEFPVPYRDGR